MTGEGDKWRKVGTGHYRLAGKRAEYDVKLYHGKWVVQLVSGSCSSGVLFSIQADTADDMKSKVQALIRSRARKKSP